MAKALPRVYFQMGKGGVGKSTSSALLALTLARQGREVLLLSLDPAHNQQDLFQRRFSDKPTRVLEGLSVVEADQDRWVKRYLKSVQDQVCATYSYQCAFNLEKHFDVLRFSPGIEEYALLAAFQHFLEQSRGADALVADMPPTAVALKFFGLPQLSLVWLERLLELRREIIRKKELITKIQAGPKTLERDRVLNRLEEQSTFYSGIRELFQDSARCAVQLVFNPDILSSAESKRIIQSLAALGIEPTAYFCNKWIPELDAQARQSMACIQGQHIIPMPLAQTPVVGLDSLQAYLAAHPDLFSSFL